MTVLLAAMVGVVSALLTIFLTPRLQHYFWTRQRTAERQLAVIEEMNKLVAEMRWVLSNQEGNRNRLERLFITFEDTFVQLWAQRATYREPAAALRCPLGTVASRPPALVAQGKIQPRPSGGAYPTRRARARPEAHRHQCRDQCRR
jgi:hypothetical protein